MASVEPCGRAFNKADSPARFYPVNPKRASGFGLKAYPGMPSVPDKVDLAVIVLPPPAVSGIIHDFAKVGASSAIVISTGCKETGAAGVEITQAPSTNRARGEMTAAGFKVRHDVDQHDLLSEYTF